MFLIGSSPLILFDPTTKELNVTVEVTRGLTQAGTDDRFFLRSAAEFTKGGTPVASIGAKDTGVTAIKDGEVRKGGKVAFGIKLVIPDDDGTCDPSNQNLCTQSTWEKIVEKDDSAGNPDAKVTMQLILIDAAGKVHVLDEATRTESVDPKGDG